MVSDLKSLVEAHGRLCEPGLRDKLVQWFLDAGCSPDAVDSIVDEEMEQRRQEYLQARAAYEAAVCGAVMES